MHPLTNIMLIYILNYSMGFPFCTPYHKYHNNICSHLKFYIYYHILLKLKKLHLKTLFNIVESPFKRLLKYDVCVV